METVRVEPFDPSDTERVTAWAEVMRAAGATDAPWVHVYSARATALALQHGWDGEPTTPYLATVAGDAVAAGSVSTSEWDNLHLAWLGVAVHPDHRRRGHGSAVLTRLGDEARALGRTTIGADGWDSEQTRGFAARHGLVVGSVAINRRQHLDEVDWPALAAAHADALPRASAYELVRKTGRTPDDELKAVAEMTMAINDAPIDDLDIEDEQHPPERIRAYEDAQLARGFRLHRVTARHRESGALAGHSVVVVDGERPERGHQHDTSVVGAHRGHRLGLLLKAEMNLWLREAEPQLATIDTWNAESNDHMIGVNELLGYRVMGRQLEMQAKLT